MYSLIKNHAPLKQIGRRSSAACSPVKIRCVLVVRLALAEHTVKSGGGSFVASRKKTTALWLRRTTQTGISLFGVSTRKQYGRIDEMTLRRMQGSPSVTLATSNVNSFVSGVLLLYEEKWAGITSQSRRSSGHQARDLW